MAALIAGRRLGFQPFAAQVRIARTYSRLGDRAAALTYLDSAATSAVAASGGSLDYAGEFRDGAMRFAGWTLGTNSQRVLQQLTFTPFGRDTVRQTFEASTDAETTWTTGFDGRYVRQRSP